MLQYEVGISSEFAISLISLLPHFIFCDVLVFTSLELPYIVVRTGTKLQVSFVVVIVTLGIETLGSVRCYDPSIVHKKGMNRGCVIHVRPIHFIMDGVKTMVVWTW